MTEAWRRHQDVNRIIEEAPEAPPIRILQRPLLRLERRAPGAVGDDLRTNQLGGAIRVSVGGLRAAAAEEPKAKPRARPISPGYSEPRLDSAKRPRQAPKESKPLF